MKGVSSDLFRCFEYMETNMSEIVSILQGIEPFYLLISSVSHQPFLKDGRLALAYTNKNSLRQMLEYLRLSGYQVEPLLINGSKPQLWEDMMAAGVQEITMDFYDDGREHEVQPIEAFTDVPKCDGFSAMDQPVINRELCRLINYYYQGLLGGQPNPEIEKQLIEKLYTSAFLVPLNLADCRGQDRIIFPYLRGSNTVPIFTDHRLLGDFLTQSGCLLDEYGMWVLSWDNICTLLKEKPDSSFSINDNTVAIRINAATLENPSPLVFDSIPVRNAV